MDRGEGTTNTTDGDAMHETTKRKTARQRYDERHAALTASLTPDDPCKTVFDGLGGLSESELKLVRALRALEAEKVSMATPPAALLEHGLVSTRRAAALLGVSLKELEALSESQRLIGEALPIVDGEVPISELLRAWRRRQADRLRMLARAVVDMVTVEGVAGWTARRAYLERPAYRSPLGDDASDGFSSGVLYLEDVATRLNVSKVDAQRLLDDDGPLFNWHLPWRGGKRGQPFVTVEEIEAYERCASRQGEVRS